MWIHIPTDGAYSHSHCSVNNYVIGSNTVKRLKDVCNKIWALIVLGMPYIHVVFNHGFSANSPTLTDYLRFFTSLDNIVQDTSN